MAIYATYYWHTDEHLGRPSKPPIVGVSPSRAYLFLS